MLIGNHPELKHWRPRGGVACPAPFPGTIELTRSVIKEINWIPPSGIKFALEHENGQCRVVKQFRDMEFARALYGNEINASAYVYRCCNSSTSSTRPCRSLGSIICWSVRGSSIGFFHLYPIDCCVVLA